MDFNKKAKTYDNNAFIQSELADWAKEWLEEDLTDTYCLEFGAGTGVFSKHVIERGGELTATDISPEMVVIGEKRYPNATWLELDAWKPKLNPKYNPFTRIYSSSLLQWAPYPIHTLKAWKECLPKGGKILSSLFVHNSLRELELIDPDICMFEWYEADSWDHYFRDAGWKIIRSETQERVFNYPGSIDIFRSLHGIGATQANRLSGTELRKLINLYDEKYKNGDSVTSTWAFYRIECSTE